MSFWDTNYAGEEYRYGTAPIPFLVETAAGLKPGRALCIGAGEGRNAVWLAQQGWEVTALDESSVGLERRRGWRQTRASPSGRLPPTRRSGTPAGSDGT